MRSGSASQRLVVFGFAAFAAASVLGAEKARAPAAAGAAVNIEANYIARAVGPMPGRGATATETAPAATAPAGPPVAIELNFIARARSGVPVPGAAPPSSTAPAGPPVTVEMNYIARPLNNR